MPGLGRGRCAELKPGPLLVQPLQASGRADRRARCSTGRAAVDTCISAIYHLTQSEGGMSSVELARRLGTGSRRLADEAEADGGDGNCATPASPSWQGRVEVDDAYLGGARRAASAAAVPPARPRSSPRSRPPRTASPEGSGSPWSRAFARKRSRSWPNATAPPAARSSPTASRARPQPSRPAATTSQWSPAGGRRRQMGPLQMGHTTLGNIKTALAGLPPSRQPEARPALPRQLRLALQPP